MHDYYPKPDGILAHGINLLAIILLRNGCHERN
ncbi:hypothetical protein J2X01_004404 [Arthrobacter ginsengisoli]|uniref:Uncharacterized protein n=1 Tax=Arthrobacter ginsengisoli TaxID=1356565 RepID=A0ABU1UIS5_9MICC|nr:hypothetical protein [Arthrobacter ginsengisoli]